MVEARIRDHGTAAGGIFTFDDRGRFIKFYTEDKYCAEFNWNSTPGVLRCCPTRIPVVSCIHPSAPQPGTCLMVT